MLTLPTLSATAAATLAAAADAAPADDATAAHEIGPELLILGALFVLAYLLGRLGKRVGLPAIPIYMIVGVLASENTHFFPLAYEAADVELVATFGLIFLLFSLGLEFDQDAFFGDIKALVLSGGTRVAINMAAGLAFGFWVGWGAREALIIAGMTAVSSSAIITKLLMELRRLANRETPTILGIAVFEDIYIAIYLAIVTVVISGETEPGPVILKLAVSFAFIVVMFVVARWGGKIVSRLIGTRDDELFTILFFGLAVAFGGIGEMIGVSDAIGAFLIGLVLGASRFRARIEQLAFPMRDLFGAFFFLNFGLALDITAFGQVVTPVAVAVAMTLVVNIAGGQLIARINHLTPAEGLNVGVMLANRGEFVLILATLATAAGLDPRLTPFAGLYVLVMAIIGPVLTVNSERIGAALVDVRRRRRVASAGGGLPEGTDAARAAARDREFALAEAAMAGAPGDDTAALEVAADEAQPTGAVPTPAFAEPAGGVDDDEWDGLDAAPRRPRLEHPSGEGDRRLAEQAREQSDAPRRDVDPEY